MIITEGFSHHPTIYLPAATKLGQGNVFTGVCDSVHRGVCLSACWDTTSPDQAPPGPDTPQTRHQPPGPGTPQPDTTPLDQKPPRPGTPQPGTPPDQTPPGPGTPPGPDTPQEADASIRSMSGQYASYWNAFLFEYLCNVLCSRSVF